MTLDQVKRKPHQNKLTRYSLPLEKHIDKNLKEEEKDPFHLSVPLVPFSPRKKVDAGCQGLGKEGIGS